MALPKLANQADRGDKSNQARTTAAASKPIARFNSLPSKHFSRPFYSPFFFCRTFFCRLLFGVYIFRRERLIGLLFCSCYHDVEKQPFELGRVPVWYFGQPQRFCEFDWREECEVWRPRRTRIFCSAWDYASGKIRKWSTRRSSKEEVSSAMD